MVEGLVVVDVAGAMGAAEAAAAVRMEARLAVLDSGGGTAADMVGENLVALLATAAGMVAA